jgi:hypothetical protein
MRFVTYQSCLAEWAACQRLAAADVTEAHREWHRAAFNAAFSALWGRAWWPFATAVAPVEVSKSGEVSRVSLLARGLGRSSLLRAYRSDPRHAPGQPPVPLVEDALGASVPPGTPSPVFVVARLWAPDFSGGEYDGGRVYLEGESCLFGGEYFCRVAGCAGAGALLGMALTRAQGVPIAFPQETGWAWQGVPAEWRSALAAATTHARLAGAMASPDQVSMARQAAERAAEDAIEDLVVRRGQDGFGGFLISG